MSIFVTGLDLGQLSDFTAMVIVQTEGTRYDQRLVGLPLTKCDVRFIDRYDLGTRYEDIAVDVGKRLRQVPLPRYLAVDETGVGRPVMEMLAYLQPYGYSAWREKDHDDLVLACSMAVWLSREVIAIGYQTEMQRRADAFAPHVGDYRISSI